MNVHAGSLSKVVKIDGLIWHIDITASYLFHQALVT